MGDGKQQILVAALLGTWGSLGLTIVHAGEPMAKVLLRGVGAHSAAGVRSSASGLDLTPPAMAAPPTQAQKGVESFPHAIRPKEMTGETQTKSANLGDPKDSPRIPSRAEQLARNFHRDGLPVARLFQSQNSLVHIGLNPRGKPGLWFVQKLH
jgi:hypothetical protein